MKCLKLALLYKASARPVAAWQAWSTPRWTEVLFKQQRRDKGRAWLFGLPDVQRGYAMLPYCVKQNVNQFENLSCSITGDMPKRPGFLMSAQFPEFKCSRILSALFTFLASSFFVSCSLEILINLVATPLSQAPTVFPVTTLYILHQDKLVSCSCSFYLEILSAVSGFNPLYEESSAVFVLLCVFCW